MNRVQDHLREEVASRRSLDDSRAGWGRRIARWIRWGGAGAGGEGEGVLQADFVSDLNRAFERFDKAAGCFKVACNLMPDVEKVDSFGKMFTASMEFRKSLLAIEVYMLT